MTPGDTLVVAKILFRSKPDPDGATVGEQQIWSRMARNAREHFLGSVAGFDYATFDRMVHTGA